MMLEAIVHGESEEYITALAESLESDNGFRQRITEVHSGTK